MSRPQSVLATVVLILGLALTTTAPASALTIEQAAPYYLAQICSLNPAINAVDHAVFRGKNTVRARQMHGKRLRQTRRALLRLQRLEAAAGNHLLSPPSPWPTPQVDQAMVDMGHALQTDRNMIVQLRKRAGRRFVGYWNNVWVPHGDVINHLDEVASDALGLTADSPGC